MAERTGRAGLFNEALIAACAAHGIMILRVERRELKALSDAKNATNQEIAEAIARRFHEIAHKLPKRRKGWQSEDDRIGLLLAVAVALSVWRRFRSPH